MAAACSFRTARSPYPGSTPPAAVAAERPSVRRHAPRAGILQAALRTVRTAYGLFHISSRKSGVQAGTRLLHVPVLFAGLSMTGTAEKFVQADLPNTVLPRKPQRRQQRAQFLRRPYRRPLQPLRRYIPRSSPRAPAPPAAPGRPPRPKAVSPGRRRAHTAHNRPAGRRTPRSVPDSPPAAHAAGTSRFSPLYRPERWLPRGFPCLPCLI